MIPFVDVSCPDLRRVALLGGAYGNVPALEAGLAQLTTAGAEQRAFLGDATGCCGHSDETLALIRARCELLVAGNHEQQAAAGADTCGCGYASPEDERWGCRAHQLAMDSLSDANRAWLGTWPDALRVVTDVGAVLLVHGSPEQTNEFLHDETVSDARLLAWLDAADAVALACTHTGIPWVRPLPGGRVAVNCGVLGKPDHDGDPAVHAALLTLTEGGAAAELHRVEYDHAAWAAQLEREGVEPIFVEPLRTGWWTTGLSSLPPGREGAPTAR